MARRLISDAAPTADSRSAALDALRAIAALMVVGMHTSFLAPEPDSPNPGLHLLRSHLWTGVDLFFALSGFLIAGPFLRALLQGRALPGTRSYVARRVARIVPGYWLALTVVVLLVITGVISTDVVDIQPVTAGGIASHYLFIHNWVPGQSRQIFVVAWTLSIEILFYLLVPVGAALIRRRHPGAMERRRLVAIIVAVAGASLVWGVAWGFAFDHVGLLHRHQDDWRTVIADNLPAQLALFCPGMLLAVLFAGDGRQIETAAPERRWWGIAPTPLLFGAALAIWTIGIVVGGHNGRTFQAMREALFMPIACGLVLLIFLRAGPVVRALTRVLAPIGVISYGIYLWHWTAGAVIGTLAVSHPLHLPGGQWFAWILAFIILCAISFPLALASWLCIERPALRWTAARIRQVRAARAA